MADVIYKKGQSANLNEENVPVVNGQILVTEDKAEMFIDMSDGTRKKISDTNKVSKDELKTINGQELIGEGDITVSGVGVAADNNAEIFNDYENNKALGKYSKASGYNTLAGIKGYYYSSINLEGEHPVITLTKEQGSEPTEEFDVAYEIGDVISLNNSTNYLNCAIITAVNKNRISVDKLPFEEVKTISNLKIWHYSFYVLNKPTVGECLFGYAAKAEGELTKAVGEHSHTEGYKTIAMSKMSHAENEETIATGGNAHAEGWASIASGPIAHAEGSLTKATGNVSHSEGEKSEAMGKVSHAEGEQTKAIGDYSHAENWITQAIGSYSHAEGATTVAEGEASHTEGDHSKVLVVDGVSMSGYAGHAEGFHTVASGAYGAHAEGSQTKALGESSHAGGKGTIAQGAFQTTIGRYNEERDSNTLFIVGNGGNESSRSNAFEVLRDGSAIVKTAGTEPTSVIRKEDLEAAMTLSSESAVKSSVKSSKQYTDEQISDVNITTKYLSKQISDVDNSKPGKYYKGEDGKTGEIFNDYNNNKAWLNSHAEGVSCEAMGWAAHAEGYGSKATGYYSHAEGYYTEVLVDPNVQQGGNSAHAEGKYTQACGIASHAEGNSTKALGDNSHASGEATEASAPNQFVAGIANVVDDNALFIVGNGTTISAAGGRRVVDKHSSAFKVMKDGSAQVQTMGTTDNSVVTKKYVDDKVGNGSGAEISVDQTYNAESENAQSGKAVAQAIQANTTSFYNPTAGDMDCLKAVNSWAVKNAIEANIEQSFGGSSSLKAQGGNAVVEAIYEYSSRTYSPTDGFPQSGFAVAQAIEQAIGNVEAVLDGIIAIQESLIGGVTE